MTNFGRRLSLTALLLITSLGLTEISLFGQSSNSLSASTLNLPNPIGLSGTSPLLGSQQSARESITLTTGAVDLSIPIISFPQLGGRSIPFSFVYSTNQTYAYKQTSLTFEQTSVDSGQQDLFEETDANMGWRLNSKGPFFSAFYVNLPALNADRLYLGENHHVQAYTGGNPSYQDTAAFCLNGWVFKDWSGTAHTFNGYAFCNGPTSELVGANASLNLALNISYATDGSGYVLNLKNTADPIVRAPDGTIYHFPVASANYNASGSLYDATQFNAYANPFTSIVDPNANTISLSGSSSGYLITDTTGRQITVGNGGLSLSWQQQSTPDGAVHTQTVSLSAPTFSSTLADFPATDDSCTQKPVQPIGTYRGPNIHLEPTPTGLPSTSTQTLTLPDGTAYKFTLNQLGQIVRVDYPTGGYTRYDYAVAGESGQQDKGDMMCNLSWRSVIAKHECTLASAGCTPSAPITSASACVAGVANGEQTTCYGGIADRYNWAVLTVKDPLGNQVKHTYNSGVGPQLSGGYINPVEMVTTYMDASSRVLKTVQAVANPDGSACDIALAQAMGIDTYVQPVNCSYTTTLNDGNPVVSSTTTTTYQLAGLPKTSVTRDFSGNTVSTIANVFSTNGIYALDSKTTTSTALVNVLNHVQTSTSTDAVKGLQTSTSNSYDAVGNLLQATRTGTSAASATTKYVYDTHGNVTQAQDPMQSAGQHSGSTTVTYTDQSIAGCPHYASSGVPTSIVNAASNSKKASYYPEGTLACSQDENGNVTKFSYDVLGRVAAINFPDGGQTTHRFSAQAPILETSTQLNGPTTVMVTDGFGRQVQSQLTSAPEGSICTETFYDAEGHTSAISNPNLTCPSPLASPLAGASTTFQYDALSRKIQQTNQDGTTQSWQYAGPYVTSTDEAGHQSQSRADAQGNLISLTEAAATSAGFGARTDYTYDGFQNLTSVTQSGLSGETARVRSFSYDGFSRLLTSSNPEVGTICYGNVSSGSCSPNYDYNGNLLSKTDARGQVVTYGYDTLNRLLGRDFNQNSVNVFTYDGVNSNSANGTTPNLAGRLSYTHDYNPDVVSSCNGTTKKCDDQNFGYDAMGRLKHWNAGYPSEWGFAAHSIDVTYDLAGKPLTMMYPDGSSVTNTYDGAGRLTRVAPTGASGAPYVSSITYWPTGAPKSVLYGNGVVENFTLNNRNQPCESKANLPSTFAGASILDRQYFYSSSGSTLCQSTSGNNGNIWSILNAVTSGTSSSPYSQGFTYDNLNRLSSWNVASMSGRAQQQTFNYDSFGNLNQTNDNPPAAGEPDPLTFPAAYNSASWPYDANNHLLTSTFKCLPLSAGVTPVGTPGQVAVYDASGNIGCSGINGGNATAYIWDADSRLSQVWAEQNNNTYAQKALYTYDSQGNRIRSDQMIAGTQPGTYVSNTFREYSYFNGQMLAEKDQAGLWTDYIYANGKKIAKLPSTEQVLQIAGSTDASDFTLYAILAPALDNYVFRTGDKLLVRERQTGALDGSIRIFAGNGQQSIVNDQDGQPTDDDETLNVWHERVIPLDGLAGLTYSGINLGGQTGRRGARGSFTVQFASIAVLSTDGTVRSVMNGLPTAADYVAGVMSTVTNAQVSTDRTATRYLLADQVGTTQLELTSTGLPMWQASSAPFGQELDDSNTTNRYKFTGKERDQESGLDYFGARYYGSNMGRFMSPDKPFADQHPENPQSWNLYTYGLNNPLRNVDVGGNCVAPVVGSGQVGICVETYIQAKRFGFLNLGHGDNRGPVANDPGATFRTQSLLTVDLGSSVTQQSRAGLSESDFTSDPGVVHARLSGQTVDKNGTVSFTLSVYGENGAEAKGNPFAPGGWIELVSSFQVAADGTVKLIGTPSTKPFPSVSMYVYLPNGKIVDLFQKRESGDVNDLNKPRFPADNTHCTAQTCSDVSGGNGFLPR